MLLYAKRHVKKKVSQFNLTFITFHTLTPKTMLLLLDIYKGVYFFLSKIMRRKMGVREKINKKSDNSI